MTSLYRQSFMTSQSPKRMNPTRSLESVGGPRSSPRWGETDGPEGGREPRKSDGLSRFRNHFDCCHQVSMEGCSNEKFEGHMIPKPNYVDCSLVSDAKSYRTSSKEREATFEVFPQHQTARLDDEGNFILEKPTREAIDQMRKKLYGNSRYKVIYPESTNSDNLGNSRSLCDAGKSKRVRFADDIGYNLEIKPTPRQDYETIIDPANWPQFEHEPPERGPESFCTYFGHTDNSRANVKSYEHPFTVPVPPNRVEDAGNQMRMSEMNRNQNYHFLTAAIYNYRLPSALHQEDLAATYKTKINESGDLASRKAPQPGLVVKGLKRPSIPEKLMYDMKTVKEEMKLMDAQVPEIPRTFPVWRESELPCTINKWQDSANSEKLSLTGKSDLQKRYHHEHPDPVPDLREHTRYTKKVFFDGFNSSAYRG